MRRLDSESANGRAVGFIRFETGVQEIFAVQVLPGTLSGTIGVRRSEVDEFVCIPDAVWMSGTVAREPRFRRGKAVKVTADQIQPYRRLEERRICGALLLQTPLQKSANLRRSLTPKSNLSFFYQAFVSKSEISSRTTSIDLNDKH